MAPFFPPCIRYTKPIKTVKGSAVGNKCANLYLLSSLACQLAECLDREELEILSSDLTALGYMLESLLAHQAACQPACIDNSRS